MTGNILVIDDLEANIKLLEAKLINEYYTVFTAQNGEKAFQIINDQKIDLILLDIMMPNMDGFEVCKKLKSNPDTMHIPVVIITALCGIEDRIRGLESGADEFLTKPINDIPLFARVKSLTRTKYLIDELSVINQSSEQFDISNIEMDNNLRKSKILFLNDDAGQIKNISKILSNISEEINIITNHVDFEKLEKNDSYYPDLIILNANLENYDSLRLCVILRSKEQFKNAAIIMITEDENYNKIIKAMELGVNDYFMYPVDKNELIARMRTQIKRKKYQDNLRKFLEQSINLSIKDGLTNIFNRRYLDIYIIQMINKSNDTLCPLSVVMFDIDYFKKINDNYSHREGDKILKIFATVLKESVRITDLVARYGGDEFIVLFKDTSLEAASNIAERIRNNLEKTNFLIGDKKISITVSGGVTVHKIGETQDDLLKRVDNDLYKAKNGGRNQIHISNICSI